MHLLGFPVVQIAYVIQRMGSLWGEAPA